MKSSDPRVLKFFDLRVLFLVCLTAIAATTCYAQGKNPCDIITKAEAESVVGVRLKEPQLSLKGTVCNYFEPGFGELDSRNKLVSIGLFYSESPDPEAVNERRQFIIRDRSLLPVITTEVSNFGDAAIWVWAGGYFGALYAFKGGTTEVTVKISGIPEEAALEAAMEFAARALGGTGKSGYVYAAPHN